MLAEEALDFLTFHAPVFADLLAPLLRPAAIQLRLGLGRAMLSIIR